MEIYLFYNGRHNSILLDGVITGIIGFVMLLLMPAYFLLALKASTASQAPA